MNQDEMKKWVTAHCKFAQVDPAMPPMGPVDPITAPVNAQPALPQDPQQDPYDEAAADQRLAALGQPFDPASVNGLEDFDIDEFDGKGVKGLENDPMWSGGGFPVKIYVEVEVEPYHPSDMNGPEEGGVFGAAHAVVTQYGKDILPLCNPEYVQRLVDQYCEDKQNNNSYDEQDFGQDDY